MDHPRLLAAIGQALGQDGPYEEHAGAREEALVVSTGWQPPQEESLCVLGGAVGAGGRVGWIEEVVYGSEEVEQPVMSPDPETGALVETTRRETWVHSNLLLRAAEGGHEHRLGRDGDDQPCVGLSVPTYNPYFGCTVGTMAWFGDVLVTIYREKHDTIAWSVPLKGPAGLVTITDAVVVRGEQLYFQGGEPGLLTGLRLPDLAPLLPIPVVSTLHAPALALEGDAVVIGRPSWVGGTEDDVEVERVALPEEATRLDPTEASRVVDRVIDWLEALQPPPRSAALLAGATLSPLYAPQTRIRARYVDSGERWATPHWLPATWYASLVRAGRGAEAAAHLAFLDAVAAMPIDDSPDRLFAIATRHVVQRARVLAEVSRTGRLPERWTCHFWYSHTRAFRRRDLPGAPAALFEIIAAMKSDPPTLRSWISKG